MKKILFTLLGLFLTINVNGQTQKTEAPVISYYIDEYEGIANITIEPVDPNTEMIYWRLLYEESEWTEWLIYEGPFFLTSMGRYQLEAYATSQGKIDSDVYCISFAIYEPTNTYHEQIADFGIDGIYYKITSDSTVIVSLNDTYDYPYAEPYGWELYSVGPYFGDVVIPPTVEYDGITYTVEGIDNFAFINCSLTSITLPNTLKTICNRAFVHATIESGSIFIPASVTTIEEGAFADCYNLNVQVDENNPIYDSRDNCNAIIETATNTLVVGFNSTTIPSTITAIGKDAFAGDAYTGHLYYTSCSFTDIVLPNGVKTIGNRAFYLCTNLKSITLGDELISIGDWAFVACPLHTIICKAKTTPTIYNNTFSFLYESDNVILFVPNESLEAYRAHEQWGKFTHIVPFSGAVPGDGNVDGNIAISDATSLIDMLLSGDELPAWADVNGDGSVGIKDVTTLIDMLLSGN